LLFVVMLVGGALVRSFVVQHRQTQTHQQAQQAFWLAESAVQRAIARRRASDKYLGESWRVSLDHHGRPQQGVAEIRVLPVAGQREQQTIEVEARWPDLPFDRVVEHRRLTIQVTSRGVSL
jgi:hypothetical protein